MRYCALQNVTINLPRLAYNSNKDDAKLFANLSSMIELAVKAMWRKRRSLSSCYPGRKRPAGAAHHE